MTILFQNPHRLFADWMACHPLNAEVQIEARYLQASFDPKDMQIVQHQLHQQQRIVYVQKSPREIAAIPDKIPLKTMFSISNSSTPLYLVDEVAVVYFKNDNPALKKPMGTIYNCNPPSENKSPFAEMAKVTRAWNMTPVIQLLTCLGASLVGRFFVGTLSLPESNVQTIAKIALTAITGMVLLRLVQLVGLIRVQHSLTDLGKWTAQARYYAYKYPDIVTKYPQIQYFLLQHEIKYLQALKPGWLMPLKNNFSPSI